MVKRRDEDNHAWRVVTLLNIFTFWLEQWPLLHGIIVAGPEQKADVTS
jgi:hypothetical protein